MHTRSLNVKDVITQRVYDPMLSPLMHEKRLCEPKFLVPYIYSFLQSIPKRDDGEVDDKRPRVIMNTCMDILGPIVVYKQDIRIVAVCKPIQAIKVFSPVKNTLMVPDFLCIKEPGSSVRFYVVHRRDERTFVVVALISEPNIAAVRLDVRVMYCVINVYETDASKVKVHRIDVSPGQALQTVSFRAHPGGRVVMHIKSTAGYIPGSRVPPTDAYVSLDADSPKTIDGARAGLKDLKDSKNWSSLTDFRSAIMFGRPVLLQWNVYPSQKMHIQFRHDVVGKVYELIFGDKHVELDASGMSDSASIQLIDNRGAIVVDSKKGCVYLYQHKSLPMIYSG